VKFVFVSECKLSQTSWIFTLLYGYFKTLSPVGWPKWLKFLCTKLFFRILIFVTPF